jgi:hypothetical protein
VPAAGTAARTSLEVIGRGEDEVAILQIKILWIEAELGLGGLHVSILARTCARGVRAWIELKNDRFG